MNQLCQRTRGGIRKVLFDFRDCILRGHHAAAGHRPQSLPRLQFLRGLLEGTATRNQKERDDRDEDCAETHEYESEAMFAKRDHNDVTALMRASAGAVFILTRWVRTRSGSDGAMHAHLSGPVYLVPLATARGSDAGGFLASGRALH